MRATLPPVEASSGYIDSETIRVFELLVQVDPVEVSIAVALSTGGPLESWGGALLSSGGLPEVSGCCPDPEFG